MRNQTAQYSVLSLITTLATALIVGCGGGGGEDASGTVIPEVEPEIVLGHDRFDSDVSRGFSLMAWEVAVSGDCMVVGLPGPIAGNCPKQCQEPIVSPVEDSG